MGKLGVEIGERISQLRKEKGLKQKELANLVDAANVQMVSKWEKGHSIPSANYIVILAKALDTTCDYLLLGKREGDTFKEANNFKTYLESIFYLKEYNQGNASWRPEVETNMIAIKIPCDSRVYHFMEDLSKLSISKNIIGDKTYFENAYRLINYYSDKCK